MPDKERFENWWEEHKNDSSFCEYCTEVLNCPCAYADVPYFDSPCTDDPLSIIDKEAVLKDLSKEDAWE